MKISQIEEGIVMTNINTGLYEIPVLPLNIDLETKKILKQQSLASRALAELKGVAKRIAAKEVLRQRQAMQVGFSKVRKAKLLTNSIIKEIQQELEQNKAGFRTLPGTHLENNVGETVYTPPQTLQEIDKNMENLEKFIHD